MGASPEHGGDGWLRHRQSRLAAGDATSAA
jgi:hypothetical protein